MNFPTHLLLSISFLLVSGCGGHAMIESSKKNVNYNKTISKLLIVIDESHLRLAFRQNEKDIPFSTQFNENSSSSAEERVAARNAKVGDQLAIQKKFEESVSAPTTALKEALTTSLFAYDVDAKAQIINIYRDKSAIAKIARSHDQEQILYLNTAAFETSQATLYGKAYGPIRWTGRVSWEARLMDRGKEISNGKPVWSAKTDFFFFGPAQCSHDAFKSCSARFSATLIQQMLSEGLLRGKNNDEQ